MGMLMEQVFFFIHLVCCESQENLLSGFLITFVDQGHIHVPAGYSY